MAEIQFITVGGCLEAACIHCQAAEELLRSVLSVGGVQMPEREDEGVGEYYLSDGRAIGIIHLSCDQARVKGLEPRQAPFLFIDGRLVLKGSQFNHDRFTHAIVEALWPDGLADLRP